MEDLDKGQRDGNLFVAGLAKGIELIVKRFFLKAIPSLVLILLAGSLGGCLLLMLKGPTPLEPPPIPTAATQREKNPVCVYAFRGLFDVFSFGMDSLACTIQHQLPAQATSLSYLEEKRVSDFLIKQHASQTPCRIVLIGHSFGADEIVTVAKRLNKAHVPVDLLISLDNTRRQIVPGNVKSYYNFTSGPLLLCKLLAWGQCMKAESNRTKMVSAVLAKDTKTFWLYHLNVDKSLKVHAYILDIIRSELFNVQTT